MMWIEIIIMFGVVINCYVNVVKFMQDRNNNE